MPLFLSLALFALLLDQLTKLYIRSTLPPGGRLELLPGWLHLQHVHNYGAAWGVFAGQKLLLIVFTLLVVGVMLFSAKEVIQRGRWAAIGFGLILGGALGNLVDRIAFGYVTDFLDLDTPVRYLQTFPVFNGADSCLTVGVILMLLTFLKRDPGAHKEPDHLPSA